MLDIWMKSIARAGGIEVSNDVSLIEARPRSGPTAATRATQTLGSRLRQLVRFMSGEDRAVASHPERRCTVQ